MDRETLEAMSKDQLYDLATDADVSGRSSMSKGELVDALADAQPETDAPRRRAGDGGVVAPGTIDPALVAARDALRAEEDAAAAEVEDRPVVGGISAGLEAAREQTIAADAASEASATVAPSGQ